MPQGNIQIHPVSAREWRDTASDLPQPRTLDSVVITFSHRGRCFRCVIVSHAPFESVAIVRLARQIAGAS